MRPLCTLGARPVASFYRPCVRSIATTTNAQASVAAGSAEAPKKRKPLTKEQRDFLDSAVSTKESIALGTLLTSPPAPRQPSRRARCRPHLCRPVPRHPPIKATPPQADGAYVRPGGRPLQDLQPPHPQAPRPTYRSLPPVVRHGNWSGLVNRHDGVRSCHGLH